VPRVLSCIQPTGDVHLGNYLGALRNWVDGQHDGDVFHGIVDLHALTVVDRPGIIGKNTLELAAMLFATGLDPDIATVFVQSHVPEHAQLAWVLQCLTGMGEAGRMTQFKDKSTKEGADRATVGLFTYPILQAADILLYQANGVPVGEDQRQHLELTRDLAGRFNARYGPTFVMPEPLIVQDTAKILDLADPTAKMSKSSAGGCLFLLDDPAISIKKIRSAVTDSSRDIEFDPQAKPGVSNLLSMIAALTGQSVADVTGRLRGSGYGDLKAAAADAVTTFVVPFQARVRELMGDPGELERALALGAGKARAVAGPTLTVVYERIGFVPAV